MMCVYPAAAVQRTMYQGSGTRMVWRPCMGSQMAYDGHYAPMLVPYSVVREPESGPDSLGYANVLLPQPALHRKTPTGKTGFRNP